VCWSPSTRQVGPIDAAKRKPERTAKRALIAQLITDTRRLVDSLEIFVLASGKMQQSDRMEYLNSESVKRHGELNSSVHEATVKALCEISPETPAADHPTRSPAS
jgi:hypothetical protein